MEKALLNDIVTLCASLSIIVGFLALMSRLKATRWLFRQLISRPLGSWLEKVVTDGAKAWHEQSVEPRLLAIEKELTTNDGTTLRDEVVATRTLVRAIAKDRGILAPDPTTKG
jgi:hypothetical protein